MATDMSYILEALKMSEQARRGSDPAQPLSLLPPAQAEEREPDRKWLRYLLVAALLLVNIAAIALWQHPVDAGAALPTPEPPPALLPAITQATGAPVTPAPPSARIAIDVDPPAARPKPADRPAPPPRPASSTAKPRADTPHPVAVALADPTPPTPVEQPAQMQGAAKAGPAAIAAPPSVPSPAEPAATDGLPPGIQKQLPPLAVSGFIQDADRNNIVIVNDRLLHEGDEAAPGVRLEEILPDGVIFSFKGYRFRR
jgi:general secretion pathway protein B